MKNNKIKKTKYPFISYFSGDFYTWVKSDYNFKSLNEEYEESLKITDEFRWLNLFGDLTEEQKRDIIPPQITDGLGFGQTTIDEFTKKYNRLIDKYQDRLSIPSEDGEGELTTIEDLVTFDNLILDTFKREGIQRKDFSLERNFNSVVEETKKMMESGKDFISFEPAFEYKGWRTRVDVLIREKGILKLYEAKASTKFKKDHALDLYYQYKLINNLGYKLNSNELHLSLVNNQYTIDNFESPIINWYGAVDPRDWDDMSPRKRANASTFEELMAYIDERVDYDYILERAAKLQELPLEKVLEDTYKNSNYEVFGKVISMDEESMQGIARWGGDRYQSLFIEVIGGNFDNSIFELKWMPVKKKLALWLKGIKLHKDISEESLVSKKAYYEGIRKNIEQGTFIPNGTRMLQQSVYDDKQIVINRKELIKEHLKLYKGPIYMYDFETFTQAIPKIEGIRPYEQVAFQYSIHIIHDANNFDPEDKSTFTHKEFLIEDLSQIGKELFTNLANDMFSSGKGTWVSWNKSFEQMVIRNELARGDLPEEIYSKLDRILFETIDMMDVAKHKWYYTPEFKGSYSIKFATKAFSPLDYKKDLVNVQNGLLASHMAKKWAANPLERKSFWEGIRKDMLRYCEYDTLSMVYIYDGIRKLIK